MKLYDEKEAIRHIRRLCDVAELSDDDILDVIDTIFDYYDENGDLDLDFDDEDDDETDDDVEQITDYVAEAFSGEALARDRIAAIVKAELDYENSLL